MTPNGADGASVDAGVPATVAAGAASLRSHADDRWVEVADRVLARALRATRRSLPVRGETSAGPFRVSEQVVVAHLRATLDGAVLGSALTAITVSVDDAGTCTGLTIEVVARYGAPLIPIADQIRRLAVGQLELLLGTAAPPVTVASMHVHVGDVTVGDPMRTAPAASPPATSPPATSPPATSPR